jgi:HPt (histidine-containing phosphotransfer) domain-containing protein
MTRETPRPANPSASPIAIDEILHRLGGDRELFKELALIYAEDSGPMLVRIRESAAKTDSFALEHAAHALKGLASNFAPNEVERIAQQLEIRGREKSWEEVDPLIERLATSVKELADWLPVLYDRKSS